MSIFDKRFVQVIEKPLSWEEALQVSGDLLKNQGKIEQSYIDKMIANVHELGPYIVIAPKVAMPHARPENGVNERGISVLTLKEPTQFSDDPAHVVSLIVCLAATDSDSHLELLQTVSGWLADETVLQDLIGAASTTDLQHRLEKFYF